MNNDKFIKCPRCGDNMEKNARYCMHCGYLNPEHSENNHLKKIIKKNSNIENFNKNKADFIAGEKNGNTVVGHSMGSRVSFIITNILIFIGLFVLAFLLYPVISKNLFNPFSYVYFSVIAISIIQLFIISNEIMFMKSDNPWWAPFIPFYNVYVLYKKVMKVSFIWFFVPIVGLIMLFIMNYRLGKAFGHNGILFILFYPIMVFVIAFGGSPFNGVVYVSEYGIKSVESIYKLYKISVLIPLIVLVVGVVWFFLDDNRINKTIDLSKDAMVIINTKNATKHVKKAISKNKYSCSNGKYDFTIGDNGTYYFYSDKFLEDFSVGINNKEVSKGYIKLIKKDGKSTYYITYVDDDYGIMDLDVSTIKTTDLGRPFNLVKPNGIMCSIDY